MILKKPKDLKKNHANRRHEIDDSFYHDKKVDLADKAYERNNITKTLISNILSHDFNLANFQ